MFAKSLESRRAGFYVDETEGDCLKIFKVAKEKEIKQVVILHSEHCWSVNPHTCEVSSPSNPNGISTVDDCALPG